MGSIVSIHSFRGGTGKSNLAANLAAKPDNWGKYYAELQAFEGDVNELVITAIALGWSDKWRAS